MSLKFLTAWQDEEAHAEERGDQLRSSVPGQPSCSRGEGSPRCHLLGQRLGGRIGWPENSHLPEPRFLPSGLAHHCPPPRGLPVRGQGRRSAGPREEAALLEVVHLLGGPCGLHRLCLLPPGLGLQPWLLQGPDLCCALLSESLGSSAMAPRIYNTTRLLGDCSDLTAAFGNGQDYWRTQSNSVGVWRWQADPGVWKDQQTPLSH